MNKLKEKVEKDSKKGEFRFKIPRHKAGNYEISARHIKRAKNMYICPDNTLKEQKMMVVSQFKQLNLPLSSIRMYVFGGIFVAGNILLPQLCHLVPDGGKILLPIYFFTLIAAYKFGLKAGLLTALLSPLCNHLLFGMPPASVLPVLLVKSSLLAVAAAWVAAKTGKLSILHIAVAVLAYQTIGGMAEWGITGEWNAALQDFRLGFPGILVQILLGWALLRSLAKYE